MKHVYWGSLLIYLNITINVNINSNSYTIGLFPSFIGYIYLVKGIDELSSESAQFTKVRLFAIGMGAYTSALYFMDLLGIKSQLGLLGGVLFLLSSIGSFYIAYVIICGIQEMESCRGENLNGKTLHTTWTWMAVSQFAMYIYLLIPPIALVLLLITIISTIIFLVQFNKSKNLYYLLIN